MDWNWAIWFVQKMLEHVFPDEAGETTLRQMNPQHTCWNAWRQLVWWQRRSLQTRCWVLNFLILELAGGHLSKISGVLALRELAFGRRRRTGTQVNRALGHAMSLFGLRRELFSVFQHAYQIVTHFEDRVRRVSASVRRGFRVAWALLLVPKVELSRPFFPESEWQLSPHHSPWSKMLVRFRNDGDLRGRCVQRRDIVVLWMRRSALLILTSSI